MQTIAIVFLILNSLIALFDGVIIHLLKLNLHFYTESKKEHKLHTLRALLFTLILIFLFYFRPSGGWIFFSISLVLLDLFVEIWDIREEEKSRKMISGLSNNEYLLHALAISSRCLALGFWFS